MVLRMRWNGMGIWEEMVSTRKVNKHADALEAHRGRESSEKDNEISHFRCETRGNALRISEWAGGYATEGMTVHE